ncbi:MAG TPA: hypothetical protein VH063_00035 [Gaiellaceae bacterium]|jgi:hypothetical protein|nr:hypothetical protein [Gaiellaceae bacterium]
MIEITITSWSGFTEPPIVVAATEAPEPTSTALQSASSSSSLNGRTELV